MIPPQYYLVTVESPSGHSDWRDKFEKELQSLVFKFGYSATKVIVEDIEIEIDSNQKLDKVEV